MRTKIKGSLVSLLLIIPLFSLCQFDTSRAFALHGVIRSASSGETIIGATVTANGGKFGTTSNEYGFYSLSLPRGSYAITFSSVGALLKDTTVNLRANTRLDVLMQEADGNLETVVVTARTNARNLRNPQMSMEKINVQEVRNVPVLFGERDIMKTMQLLPGVKPAGEGNSGFYVRGGSSDQNLILLDEAPVYNASHLLGFFSTFNSDALKNVTLYKGGIPAQYGGRLSSVVDIKMNDGNNQHFGVSGGIGLIASRLNIEGPLQKNRSSFLLSGRRTYADLFVRLLGDSTMKNTQLYFYDLNAKSNFILDEKNTIYLSGYFGRDVLSQDRLTGINWGNATGTFRWNHIFNRKVFSNTSFIFSNYDYRIQVTSGSAGFRILSRIRDWNIKEELQWFATNRHTVSIGLNAVFHTITPGRISMTDKEDTLQDLSKRYSLENALYFSNTWRTSDKINIVYGFRLSSFSILGRGEFYNVDAGGTVTDTLRFNRGELVKNYVNPEPRLAISYSLDPRSSIKASLTRNVQYLHLVSNSTSSSPTDKWVASTNIIKPEVSDQVALGYYRNFDEGKYELNIETYYKNMQNQIEYRNGAEVFSNEAIESQLLYGKGRAYGIEWLWKKTQGDLTGWLSYTLSKTEKKIDGINDNNWFNARQDRTHDIALVGIYQLNPKWTLSATWVYYTGDAVTFPSGKYTLDGNVYYSYTERNSYRMPDYHRLDLGATKQFRKRKRSSSELSFSLYNAYGRANAYQIRFRQSETDPDKTEAVQTSLFTFVPSISYNFKF